MSSQQTAKQAAASRAVELVEDGMTLGLGSGTTAALFLAALGARVVRENLRVTGVPTSDATRALALDLGLELTTLEATPALDLAIDGADEIDADLNVLKGGGGALLHEKIVALASKRFMVIADEGKLVSRLGATRPIPVEVVAFGWKTCKSHLEELGARAVIRGGEGGAYVTDSGNLILDVSPPDDADIFRFVDRLKATTGVVDHGVFRHLVGSAVIGRQDGSCFLLQPGHSGQTSVSARSWEAVPVSEGIAPRS